LASYYDRFSFENRNDLVGLYNNYRDLLIKNNIEKLSTKNCYYIELRNNLLKDEELKKQEDWNKRSLIIKIKDKLKSFLK
jgi:hypothetical protein